MNKSDRQRFDELERLVKANTTILSKIETFLTTGKVIEDTDRVSHEDMAWIKREAAKIRKSCGLDV